MTVRKANYERIVLGSLLLDASNVLIATKLRPAGLLMVETSRLGWSDQLVIEYLPAFGRAVPLTPEAVTAPAQSGDGKFWVKPPRHTVREALEVYLAWFLDHGISLGAVHADANSQFIEELVEVADGVAKSANERGFSFSPA